MPFDLKALTKNKPAMIGLAGAAGLGLYVLYKRKQTTGSTSSQPTTTATTGTGAVGTFDSSGTDIATWLGNYSGNLQNQLDAYQQQLTDALSGLQQVQPTQPSQPTTPTPTPPFNPPPPPTTNTPPASHWVTVQKYTSSNPPWNSTLSGIAAHENTTVSNLLKLNPGIKNPNLIYPNQQIRVS